MIKCDNEKCLIEWFHFKCVGLNCFPKGKWYCSKECYDFSEKQGSVKVKINYKGKDKK